MSFEPRECFRHIVAEADDLIGTSSGLSPDHQAEAGRVTAIRLAEALQYRTYEAGRFAAR